MTVLLSACKCTQWFNSGNSAQLMVVHIYDNPPAQYTLQGTTRVIVVHLQIVGIKPAWWYMELLACLDKLVLATHANS